MTVTASRNASVHEVKNILVIHSTVAYTLYTADISRTGVHPVLKYLCCSSGCIVAKLRPSYDNFIYPGIEALSHPILNLFFVVAADRCR